MRNRDWTSGRMKGRRAGRGSYPIFPEKEEDGLAWGEDSPAGERVDPGWLVEMRQSPQGVLRVIAGWVKKESRVSNILTSA